MAKLVDIINNEKYKYVGSESKGESKGGKGEGEDEIGLVLVMARGIGKLCNSKKIVLGADFDIGIVRVLVNYIRDSNNKPDEDGTHIVLELLLKLTDSTNDNKDKDNKNNKDNKDSNNNNITTNVNK